MVKHIIQEPSGGRNIRFPESALAHKWCVGHGAEFGSASHNPWNLPDCINIAPQDDFALYQAAQVELCGMYCQVDVWAEAENVPLPDNSLDYVISSHVAEHFPDPIRAFKEWTRLVRDGGIVYMVLPLRDALEADKARPLSTVEEIMKAHEDGVTVDTWNYETNPIPGGRRGHYFVWEIGVMKEVITRTGLPWELVTEQERDSDKVGNGFVLVYKINKPVAPNHVRIGKVEFPIVGDEIMVSIEPPAKEQVVEVEAVKAEPETNGEVLKKPRKAKSKPAE